MDWLLSDYDAIDYESEEELFKEENVDKAKENANE